MVDLYHYLTIQEKIKQTRSGLYIVSFVPKIYKSGRLIANPDYLVLTPQKLVIGEVNSIYHKKQGEKQLRKYKKLLKAFENIETELILYKKID